MSIVRAELESARRTAGHDGCDAGAQAAPLSVAQAKAELLCAAEQVQIEVCSLRETLKPHTLTLALAALALGVVGGALPQLRRSALRVLPLLMGGR